MTADTQITDLETAISLGLSEDEYKLVCGKLERNPNWAELGIFSAMFSEHCSYKSSKPYFKRFPTTGKHVLQGPGENAGILDLGEGWAVAFKMESHNHPSFIEPYQGAATGVGGILRDVFTMGARPVASMNSLCFGAADNPLTPRLVKGVVKGIGDYGNSVGVPMVAGQTFFHPSFNGNPLVNAFTAGLVRHENIFRAAAAGIGNLVVYAGAKTGRDGVHGATMASQEFNTEAEPERPTVQVGDPFTEKLLIEATLEAMKKGLILSIQDMGAAGITSSSFEMASRAGTGLSIDLDRIPTREKNMSAYELLLSESQERMLIVTDEKRFKGLKEVFEKWDLHAETIGRVEAGNRVRMTRFQENVVDLPVELVASPPMADRPVQAPSDTKQLWFMDRNKLHIAPLEEKLRAVTRTINFADASALVEQYDSMVGNRTEGGTFDDGAVIRLRDIKEKALRLAFSVDCNPRIVRLDPREGGRRAVIEAALNVAVRGAKPLGVTDCLNFGSPENPEVMWQFSEAVEGISEACEAIGTPVVSGNVSFYNDTDGQPIAPAPMIGMVGVIEGKNALPESSFFGTDLEIAIAGEPEAGLGGSVLACEFFKRDCGQPAPTDLPTTKRMLKLLRSVYESRFSVAVHDISDGGAISGLLEMCFRAKHKETGLEIVVPTHLEMDNVLFGEAFPRILLAYSPDRRVEMETLCNQNAIKLTPLGRTTDRQTLVIKRGVGEVLNTGIQELKQEWVDKWKGLFN